MLTIVHITYHDETNIGSCPIGQTGGFENADGNGEIHCFRIFDGVSVMLMQLEMGSYTEIRTQVGVLEVNFCINGRFETSFSMRSHVLLKPGDMAISCYDGLHGTKSESHFPLGYYEGLCLEIDPAAAGHWIRLNAPAFPIDFTALKQNLLGSKWYMVGPAGPRCEHVFRELYESASYAERGFLQLKVLELMLLLGRIPQERAADPYCSAEQTALAHHLRDHLLTNREGYVSLAQLAAEHAISVSHLQKLFKQTYGMPVYHYIKEYRLEQIAASAAEHSDSQWTFIKGNLADKALIDKIFADYKPEIVVNLAAQAGVRYSITNPDAYIESNLIGFYNILEACRHSYDEGHTPVEHLVYASSSSVYGSNKKVPYSTDDKVDNPVSLYAATKKSNELMAHAYSKLYNIPSTGLRFFTVYGPAGRPDMAYFGFTNKLLKGETIQIFNYGNCKRDFTYVDDIVEGVVRVMQGAPERKNGEDGLPVPPYAVYNIGNQNPENLLDFVQILQEELIRAGVLPEDYDFEAHKKLVPMQPGDVPVTYADTSALERDFGYKPSTSLREGLRKFAEWYAKFYK